MMKRTVLLFLTLSLLLSCGQRAAAPVAEGGELGPRAFPVPVIPAVYSGSEERVDYLLDHFWDAYLAGEGVTDSTAILGVAKVEVEAAMADYIRLLDEAPMSRSQRSVRDLFAAVELVQARDSSSHFFLRFTEMVAKYLYDPNSPVRSEDYFLPFVQGLAESPWTGEEYRAGYRYQARVCALNQFGQKVPDFKYKDGAGRVGSLYGIKADFTVLMFSNPGCNACKDIVDELESQIYMDDMIKAGRFAILSMYVDAEVEKWREYLPNYPSDWIVGRDHLQLLRDGDGYDIRAIPSLYLLDADKRVILKDAPVEKVLRQLEKHIN